MKQKSIKSEKGSALLVVLFIIMTISLLSLGFLSRSDTEFACGQNTVLHEQMDALAYSGLDHAKGLILYPQELATPGYWTGRTGQHLVAGNDYYDVKVTMHDSVNDPDPTYRCTYNISSEAYRIKDSTRTAQSAVQAELRLDPSIAYWTDADNTVPARVCIYGDTYCGGNLMNLGILEGDVFASSLYGTAKGQTFGKTALVSVTWPNVITNPDDYSVSAIPTSISNTGTLYTSPKVYSCAGSMNMQGNVELNGMLWVQGDLQVSGTGNYIAAAKNLPALYVTGNLMLLDGAQLNIYGLAVVNNRVGIRASAADVNVFGGVFAKGGIFEAATDSTALNNTAYLFNGPVWRPSNGQVNGAIQLDGVDDFLQTADSGAFNKLQLQSNYTFSVWVNADPNQKDGAAIFAKTDPAGSTNHWSLQFDSSNPKKLIVCHPNETYETGITLPAIAGAWHHIRIIRNSTFGTITAYLDDSNVPYIATTVDPPAHGLGHLNIGADKTVSSAHVFKGLIDDLRIFNVAPAGNPPGNFDPAGNFIAYWTFDKSGNGKMNIYASPDKAALIALDGTGKQVRWGQAGGAFYRTIKRN